MSARTRNRSLKKECQVISWFDLIYFGLMLLLALWLAGGIYFSLREKMVLGVIRPFVYTHPAQTAGDRVAERNRDSEFTSSRVREAFELFLNNFESRKTNQNR
jgi:hypothetical protein